MRKIISLIITLTALLSFATVTPVNAAATEDEGIISLLKELEIMEGDENGDMLLDRKVSRAEFAKIAIAASPEKNSVALGLNQSPFKDVPYTTWHAPYVKAAVSAGYVMGYLDATFRPENTVTYEEAATILIRVLGYDDSAFSAAYPYGQLSKAQSLDLLDDVDAQIGDELTRYQVMRMIYNALNAVTASNAPLYASHDCALYEDADIIATAEQDNSLGTDKVFTSKGAFTKGVYFDDTSAGMTGDIYVKNQKDIIAFVPDTSENTKGYEPYFVYSVLSNNTVVGYTNGSFSEINIPESAAVYKNQNQTTYAAVKASLEMGDTLYIKRTLGGSVDYVTYNDNDLNGPVTVTSDSWLSQLGANGSSKVYRGGVQSGVSDISTNDIVYYSEPFDVVFAYTDKVTGIYESASPNKDTPKSVKISGVSYEIESVEAFNALSSNGSFRYGDTVTLLLGKEGDIAGVSGTGSGSQQTSASSISSSGGVGFVTETGKKDFTNADGTVYSSYYVKIVYPDGLEAEYPTSVQYSSLVCSAARITLKNRKATLTKYKTESNLTGEVNAEDRMIGNVKVADYVKIIDTVGTYSDASTVYRKVYLQRLDGVKLASSSVRYYSKNSNGEIDELILKDVTGDLYTYAYIVSRNKLTGAYTIDIEGSQSSYLTGFTSTSTGPARLLMANGTVKNMQQLAYHSVNISGLTDTEAVIGSEVYLLSDNVIVYHKQAAGTYMKIPLEDAVNGNYRMTAYYDKAESYGGRIRIIIAQDRN